MHHSSRNDNRPTHIDRRGAARTLEAAPAAPTVVAIGATFLAVAALWYLFAEAVTAIGFPGYSYSHNWISDLGIPEEGEFQGRFINSQLAGVMNAGFLGHGLLLILGMVMLTWSLPAVRTRITVLVLAVIHGFGIALVGLVHGSQLNATAGLIGFHFGGAFMAILGGNILLIVAGHRAFQEAVGDRAAKALVALGMLGLASVVMLGISQGVGHILVVDYGVWERASVYSIMVGELLIAVTLLRHRRVSTEAA